VTWRYAIALLIIAMLSTVTYVILLTALKGSEDTAYVVNISGKQRMLSQTIALDVFRLYQLRSQGYYEDPAATPYQIERVLQRLNQNISEMRDVNMRLSKGYTSQNSVTEVKPISDALFELYFGELNLAQEVDDYLEMISQCIAGNSPSPEGLHLVSAMAPKLLVKLNTAVLHYQQEGEHKLAIIQQIKTYVWIVTLFMLLLEVVFIFQPMVRQIVFLARENQHHVENLESKVKLRTQDLELANEKLKQLAMLDPLTGLFNRLNLEKDIEQQILQQDKHQSPFAVLMLDIDYFKHINDSYGHEVGDLVLKELAKILKASVRKGDSVYRAGGEEFVVLLSRIDYEDTLAKAEQIRHSTEQYAFMYGVDKYINLTISIGVYHTVIYHAENVRDLMKQVDVALYQSKANGRNQVTLVERLG
jgi:diguanylate cyclase (GGDEF)-like protein